MAHKTFVIEKFLGEATNQLSRMTNQPTKVVGRFDRLGGIGPQKALSSQYYKTISPPDGYHNLGYDWLGVSAFKRDTTDDVVLHYSQSGQELLFGVTSLLSSDTVLYAPGAGLVGLSHGGSALTNPTINEVFYINTLGYPTIESPYSTSPTISMSGTGTWAAGDIIYAVAIMFRQTAHGLLPMTVNITTHTVTSAEAGTAMTASILPIYSDGLWVNLYVAAWDSSTLKKHAWHLAGSKTKEYIGVTFNGSSDLEAVVDSTPTFYGAPVNLGGTYITPEQYTATKNRSFFVGHSKAFLKLDIDGSGNVTLGYPSATDSYKRRVYFSDEGYTMFSHTQSGPNNLKFDDEILAVAPGQRGVYALSGSNIFEAYGDFETGTNTRIDNIPMLGGVTASPYSVTYGAGKAYFIKGDIVHSIGNDGIKQVGRPIFVPGAATTPSAINYDRFSDALLVRYGTDLYAYRPDVGQWAELNLNLSSWLTEQDVAVVLEEGRYFFNGYDVTKQATADNVVVEFSKLDLGLPSKRKRIHRIIMDYEGAYTSFSVSIREYGTSTWQACTAINRGDSVEVRCPTVVARAFDLKIDITPVDTQFVLNPPMIFTFEERGPKYDRY